ncbi:hypothetical protein L593_12285 [Salinarchaeum sp. Harcht-Bsk1]|uniref:hypothetical protein n=1 Tax=Salinarchaeum sp. Harcht-Bsk1 TaxID=1333523 RepID=UPI00034229FB|nr:hypothetical protein [Salinarchaeum sp. Harcht-Bsk1]AGN02398.1 hypothetical protein L593_12285 [Salinarchaeum sp. Harcht-Bsk1]
MSLFEKIGLGGGDSEAESDAESSREVEDTGPNFMPEKQRELYVKAYENKLDLSDSGTCSECGTTLKPVKADELLASCKNEDCENHLNETEINGAKRFYDRNGHPDDLDGGKAAATDGGDGERNALDGLRNAMDEE